jgi:hypothetical protein
MLPYTEPDNSQMLDWQFNDPCLNFLWRIINLGILSQMGCHALSLIAWKPLEKIATSKQSMRLQENSPLNWAVYSR